MAPRLGVDVGGTFTDLVFYDDTTGQTVVAKAPTTPAPDEGVAGVVADAVSEQSLASAAFFLHGTTVGLNALLQRRGAVVGLLATRGFRDILEFRRGLRDAMYDPLWKAPPPLVPRRLRLPVTERVRADGTIEIPLSEDDVRLALETFTGAGVECIAVAFLNAYVNAVHELATARLLRECSFVGDIALSHQVTGEFREYERTSTTVIDAYVRPQTARYLRRLKSRLDAAGFRGDCLVTRCGGGSMSFEEGESRPFETIMSGTVAGAAGAADLCVELGIATAISADVGGTSFDTCLIVDGRAQLKYEGTIDAMPVQTPWVDVRSIGAGGGSLAYIDQGGLLRVGPESAGGVPGPACYGIGGTRATVTDAAAVLGMLAFGELAGGLRLDRAKAETSLLPLGEKLGLAADDVAKGIVRIATTNMADAIRSITIEQGQDPRRATLVAFGGAGPVFATLLASELHMAQILVPRDAGGFSAWGMLGQDVTRSAAKTVLVGLDAEGVATANAALVELWDTLEARAQTPPPESVLLHEVTLELRFVGQEHTLAVSFPLHGSAIDRDAASIHDDFVRAYERRYGYTMDEEVEVVSVRATTRMPLPRKRAEFKPDSGRPDNDDAREIIAYSFLSKQRLAFSVRSRASLRQGDSLNGPVIVTEPTTTIYVDEGWKLSVQPNGHTLLTKGAS
jgi:N-methylhydantoinase A